MRGLVNFAKEPYSAELHELPVPEIDEDDLLISVRAGWRLRQRSSSICRQAQPAGEITQSS